MSGLSLLSPVDQDALAGRLFSLGLGAMALGGAPPEAAGQEFDLREGLEELQKEFPEIGDIRQAGLHIGVELVGDPETKEPLMAEGRKVRDKGIKHGLILGLAGPRPNILKVKPPLTVTQSECDEILDKFATAMRNVFRK